MKRILLFVNLLLVPDLFILPLYAQIRPAIHFTEDDGLPGNTVRDLIKDKEGILWIATDNGIAKFDGDKFVNINKSKGLPLTMSWALACGEGNEIYAGLFKGGLALIKNDSVKTIIKSHDERINRIRKLYFSNFYKKLFIGTDYGLYFLKDSVFVPVLPPEINGEKSSVLAITGRDSLIFFCVEGESHHGINKIFVNKEKPENFFVKRITPDGRYSCLLLKDTLYGGWYNKIFRFDLNNLQKQYPPSEIDPTLFIWSMSPYKDNKLWIGGFGDDRIKADAVLYDPLKNSSMPINTERNIETVSVIFYDTISKVTWFGRDNGLIAYNESPFEYSLTNSTETILDLGLAGDSLLVLTENGVYYLKEGKMKPVVSKKQALNKLLYGYQNYPTPDGKYHIIDNWTFSEFVSFIQTDNKLYIRTQTGAISVPDLKTYLPFEIGTFMIVKKKGAYYFKKYETLRFNPSFRNLSGWHTPDGPGGKVTDVSEIIESEGIVYCKTNTSGLYALKNNIVYRLSEENSTLDNVLTGIDKDLNGNIWCLSANCKLYEVGFSDSLIIHKEFDLIKSGLVGNICRWIKFDGRYLLVGTNKGLNVIRLKSLDSENPVIEFFYNNLNGYNYVSAGSPVTDKKGKVYLHTFHEIVSIDTNFTLTHGGKIYINNLLINDRHEDLSKLSGKSLPFKHKQLSFIFSAIKYPSSRNFRYKFKVNNGGWIPGNQVVLQSLRPGNYKISMEGQNLEDRSVLNTVLTFNVKPPFWMSIWFILIAVLSLSIASFFFMRWRINKLKKEQEEKTRLIISNSELQLRSLQIQMNPHFIFNTLNSIQSFILKKKTEESLKYLGELASIIRTNLENASEEYINLSDEIEFLKKYVEIEQMRFKDKLKVEFRNNVMDSNIMIPPMLIQPLLENSIKHGVRILPGIGIVRLNLDQTNDILSVVVEDNGVGMEQTKKSENYGYKGKGLKIISQRLDLLNKMYHTNLNGINFYDIHDNGMIRGTKVVMILLLKRST